MHARVRSVLPQAAVSSDFIVGFCGETDEDFQATIDLLQDCRFKNSFIFKYSERPGTKAAGRMVDDVPMAVKKQRNNLLLKLQSEISEQDNQRFLGESVSVLVEGPSKSAIDRSARGEGPALEPGHVVQMTGRTHCDRIVVFDGNMRQAGHLLPVTIYDATPFTLHGEVVTEQTGPELFTLQA